MTYVSPSEVDLVASLPAGATHLLNHVELVTHDDGSGTVGGVAIGLRTWNGTAWGLATLMNATSGGAGSVTLAGDVTGPSGSNIVVGLTGSAGNVAMHGANILWDSGINGAAIGQTSAGSGAGHDFLIFAQGGATGNNSGGTLRLASGAKTGAGVDGAVKIEFGSGLVAGSFDPVANALILALPSISFPSGGYNFKFVTTLAHRAFPSAGVNHFEWYEADGTTLLADLTDTTGFTTIGRVAADQFIGIGTHSNLTLTGGQGAFVGLLAWGAQTSGNGIDNWIVAQAGQLSGTSNGAALNLSGGGFFGVTGRPGGVKLTLGVVSGGIGSAQVGLELVDFGTFSARITALNRYAAMSTTQMPANSGDGVSYIANAATDPTGGVPVGGSILYASGGSLRSVDTRGIRTEITSGGVATAGTLRLQQVMRRAVQVSTVSTATGVLFQLNLATLGPGVFEFELHVTVNNITTVGAGLIVQNACFELISGSAVPIYSPTPTVAGGAGLVAGTVVGTVASTTVTFTATPGAGNTGNTIDWSGEVIVRWNSLT